MKSIKYTLLGLTLGIVVFFPRAGRGSDHIDFVGGLTQTEIPPHADLTDLYSWVSEDGKLTLALNTFIHPINANPAPGFDGSVEYRFEIRKADLKEPTQLEVPPDVHSAEAENHGALTSQLRVPELQKDFRASVICRPMGIMPNCMVNVVRSEQLEIKRVSRAVAGRKADSFILDFIWADKLMEGVIDPNIPSSLPVALPDDIRIPIAQKLGLPPTRNSLDVINILNLTVELDIASVLGADTEFIAVAAESFLEEDGNIQRVDRVGRPEITNMTIGLADVKKAYNAAATFDLSSEQIVNYQALIRYGVLGWDRQDGKADWVHNGELHDLLDILVLDALIVDTTKECDLTERSFLDVERGQGDHTTCGGRVPKDDVIDTMFSLYTAGVDAANDLYGDGADLTSRQPLDNWPYFVAP